MPDAKQVFISHISEEAALGAAVKTIIEDVFTGDRIQAFLSSDMHDLPAGRNWLNEISKQLDQAQMMVSLISPASLMRPWVNIELGAAWNKGMNVIPLCHSGQLFGKLPRPFQDSTGVDLDRPDPAQRLLIGIADGLGVAAPSKRLNYDVMSKELRDVAAGVVVVTKEDAEAPSAHGLPPEQVRILQVLAIQANRGNEDLDFGQLAGAADVLPAVFKHHIYELEKRKFVHISHYTSGVREASLQPAGSKWLIDSGNMP